MSKYTPTHRKATRLDTYTLPTRALLAAVLGVAMLLGPVAQAGAHDGHQSHQHMEMCASEDGWDQEHLPCMWDAKHQGNGLGSSYILRRSGEPDRVTHKRAHRVLTYWRGQV